MSEQEKPFPKLAVIALNQLQQAIHQAVQEIGVGALEAAGVSAEDGWRVDVQGQRIYKPDSSPAQPET